MVIKYLFLSFSLLLVSNLSLAATELEACGTAAKVEGTNCKNASVAFDLTNCEAGLGIVQAKITCSKNEISAGYKTVKHSYRLALEPSTNWGTAKLAAKGKLWRAVRTSYSESKNSPKPISVAATPLPFPLHAEESSHAPASVDESTWGSISVTANLRSVYVWHGIAFSDGAAIEGSFDYSHPTGISAGIWTSNYAAGTTRYTEVDYYLGYGVTFMEDFSASLLATYFTYIDNIATNNFEFTASLGYKFLKLSYSYYPQLDGADINAINNTKEDNQTQYVRLAGDYPINEHYGFKAHIGMTNYKANDVSGSTNYEDYLVGAYKKVDGFTLTMEWTDTNRKVYDGGTLPPTTRVESHVRDQRTNFMVSKTF